LVLCCASSYAQQATARLLGTVLDPTGAAIGSATISVINVATSQQKSVSTNASGEYSIPLLPIGEYTIRVEAPGFQAKSLKGVILQVDQEARLDITMTLGSTMDTITVQAEAPLLVTDTSSVGQVIENKAIASMPLNGRAFWQLAQLTPGVVFTPGGSDITSGGQGIRATRVGLRISGSSRLAGGWFLDGFDITEYELGATSITPSTDALEEFKVMAGGMSAEYALPSVINAALKSGSNQFHGSAYEYIRNEKLQARNFFAAKVAPLKRNQFGATFGGPIKKDTVFFFADYEGGRTRQGTTFNSFVPSAEQLRGDFSGGRLIFDPLSTRPNPANPSQFIRDPIPDNIIRPTRIASQAAFFTQYFPAPNSPGSRYAFSPALALDTDKFDIKVSSRISANNTLVSRYSFANNTESDPSAYPTLGFYPLRSRSQNVGLSYTHIFTPRVALEVAGNYYRTFFYFLNASAFNGKDVVSAAGISGFEGISNLQPAAPLLNLSGYQAWAGSTDNRPKANRIRTYQYRSLVTWSRAKHDMKFGVQLSHQAHAFLNGNASQGTFNFDGRYSQNPLSAGNTGDAFADFLLGYPFSVQRATPIQIFGDSGNFLHTYGQDDFRISRNLTLNVGVRWEINSMLVGIRGQANAFDFATGKIIIPSRMGTPDLTAQPGSAQAWTVFRPLLETTEEKGLPWSLRHANPHDIAPRIGLAWRPFGSTKWVVRSSYGIFYVYPDSNILLGQVRTPPFVILQVINNDVPTTATPTPRRNLANYFLGQPLVDINATPAPTTGGTDYVTTYTQTWNLNVQHEFAHNIAMEVGYVGNKGTHLQTSSEYNVPLPGPGNVQARRPYPQWGILDYKIWGGSSTYHSLQSKLEKRFSGGFSFLGSYSYSKCLDAPGSEESSAPAYYLDNFYKGRCDYDVPQNFVTSYLLELPLGKGRRFLSSSNRVVEFLAGGWQWQGINTLQSGVPYSVTINVDRANTGVGSQRPDLVAVPVQPRTLGCWYFTSSNPVCRALLSSQADSFVLPANFAYGNAGRNILRGDKLIQLDMSLIKNFRVTESKSFDFRAQVFNLTNTPSFSSPSGAVNLPTGGQVTSTRNQPRLFEFGLKFNF
jgi:hypothetical protein